MKSTPEISVVITCFNYGHYLEGCLNSVINQTYQDFEIVVVDDGSEDNTREVVDSFSGQGCLKYIFQENGGQAKAKNRGIACAQGRFVAFLDADDLWEKEKLAKQIVLFERPTVAVVYTRAKLIDEASNPIVSINQGKYLKPRSGMVASWLFIDNFVPFSSAIIRREAFERFKGFDENLKMGIDWDLWLRIATTYEFQYVNEDLLLYRVGHLGQMSKKIEVRQECSDRIMKKFLDLYPGAVGKETIQEAYYYTYCNRGNYFRQTNKSKSYLFLLKAIRAMPFRKEAYKEIIKNFLY